MSAVIDKDVLAGFIEEVNDYLPEIRQGIAAYQNNPADSDKLEDVHRYVHTIKGASSMVGLTTLSRISFYLEDVVEALSEGGLTLNESISGWLDQTVQHLESCLADALSGRTGDNAQINTVTRGYEQIRGVSVDSENGDTPADLFDEDLPLDNDSDDDEAISPELMEVFGLEAEEHLQQILLSLVELEKNPNQHQLLQDVRRSVHTLKGAASTIGLQIIADMSHRMEDLLDQLYDQGMTLDSDALALLLASADMMEEMLNNNPDAEIVQATLQEIYAAYDDLLATGPAQPQPITLPINSGVTEPETDNLIWDKPYRQRLAPPKSPPSAGSGRGLAGGTLKPPPSKGRLGGGRDTTDPPPLTLESTHIPSKPDSSEVIRVPIERLDDLIKLVSELVITRSTFEQEINNLVREVEELRPSINRLRHVSTKLEVEYEASALGSGLQDVSLGSQPIVSKKENGSANHLAQPAIARTHDFDELEFDRYTEFHLLSRELTETTSDVSSIGNALKAVIGNFRGVFNRQVRLSGELQEKLIRTRMVPLSTLATRLHRAVRVVAQQRNKLAELEIEGAHIELDKTVLEEIADPLLHLLRNAVDHGLESPAWRKTVGKPERGQIRLYAYHEGNQVVIQLSDDGAGLNYEAIRAKAANHGYIPDLNAQNLSEGDLQAFLFLPGFSTATEVSEVSGRGVGLDVVKANINKLKGTVTLNSVAGQGTTFTIRLPMTLAVTRALFVKIHAQTFAIPLNAVTRIIRLKGEEIKTVVRESVLRLEDKIHPVSQLDNVLGLARPAGEIIKHPVALILEAGGQQVALIVDDIIHGREVVVKTLGNHLRYVHGIMGATLMGDGSIVLILNPAELVRKPSQLQPQPQFQDQAALGAHGHTPTIMVVDDSISVRRVVSKLVEKAGWQPVMAKDGLEALELVQQAATPPDLILLDVEMPRMDGYELTSILRGQSAFQRIPIVMLTSRAGEKHRRKAFELGVSDYVTKPYQDETLRQIIRQFINE